MLNGMADITGTIENEEGFRRESQEAENEKDGISHCVGGSNRRYCDNSSVYAGEKICMNL